MIVLPFRSYSLTSPQTHDCLSHGSGFQQLSPNVCTRSPLSFHTLWTTYLPLGYSKRTTSPRRSGRVMGTIVTGSIPRRISGRMLSPCNAICIFGAAPVFARLCHCSIVRFLSVESHSDGLPDGLSDGAFSGATVESTVLSDTDVRLASARITFEALIIFQLPNVVHGIHYMHYCKRRNLLNIHKIT